MKPRGKRGQQLEADRREWRKRILALWGKECLFPYGGCAGHIEIAHAYTKGAHPADHVADWNGFPICAWHHRLGYRNFEFHPPLKRALQRCADEVRAALEGRQEMPIRDELRHIIGSAIRRDDVDGG